MKRIWWTQSEPDHFEVEEELPEASTKKTLISSLSSPDVKVSKIPQCVASLKDKKGPVGGVPVSQFVYTAFIKSCFKTGQNPGDELFQVDDDLVDHILSAPSLLTRMAVLKWELLQAMLVIAGRDSPIFRNKERYMEAFGNGTVGAEDNANIFRYLVDMVDPLCAGNHVQFPSLGPPECQQLQKLIYQPVEIPWPIALKSFGKQVLCIDGGGIRGLVPLQLLEALQLHCLKEQQQRPFGLIENFNISTCFDLIAGTSTGALIALALATNRSLDEIRQIYFKMKDKIFVGPKPYDGTKYEEILKEFFGATTKMNEIRGVKIIITAVYGSVQDLRLKLFTNFDEETGNEEIWKVARRTSSAPGYFDPMQESGRADGITEFFDGGLAANNPTMKILTRFGDLVKNGTLISLGTGKLLDKKEPLPKIRMTLQGRTTMFFNGDLDRLATAFVNQVTKTDGDLVEDCQKLCDNYGTQFFRLTPTLAEQVALDETCDDKILNMLWHTKAFTNHHNLIFQKIGQAIVRPQEREGTGCCLQ